MGFRGTATVVCVAAGLAMSQTVYLYNGSFSQCSEPCPAEYGNPSEWAIEGGNFPTTVGVWRDVSEYNSAPASLAVMSINADSSGNYNQEFRNSTKKPAAAGQTYTWEAYVKVDSTRGGSVQLVAHFSCGIYWTECASGGWTTLHGADSVTDGWVKVSGTATVPTGATWGLFRVFVSGIVTGHVDDIKINGQDEVVPVVYDRDAARMSFARARVDGSVITLPRNTAYTAWVARQDGRMVSRVQGTGATIDLGGSDLARGTYVVNVSAKGVAPFSASVMLGE